jgi:hypothetical protein
MAIKYINIFQSKALQNLPKSGNPEQNFARCFCNFPEFGLLQLGSSVAAKL